VPWWPVPNASANRNQFLERRLDPILRLHRVEGDVLCDAVAGGDADEFADLCLIGRLRKMHGDVPAPVRPLERGDRGLPLKKTLGQEIEDAPRGPFVADREGRTAGAGGDRGSHLRSGKLATGKRACVSV
jgi:hypothetical protein